MLFNKDRTVITKHINKILKESEVDKQSNVQKVHFPNSDKLVMVYSLDIVLAVGYRTNSEQAMKFRKWATNILKDYLIQGYSINKKLLETQQDRIKEIQKTLDFLIKSGKSLDISDHFLEVLSLYTNSLVTLNHCQVPEISDKQIR